METFDDRPQTEPTQSVPPVPRRDRIIRMVTDMLSQMPLRQLERVSESIGRESLVSAVAGMGRAASTPTDQWSPEERAEHRNRPEPLRLDNVEEAMAYQPWGDDELRAGDEVREALLQAAKTILRRVPSSENRTLALQHVLSARLHANVAITFHGRF